MLQTTLQKLKSEGLDRPPVPLILLRLHILQKLGTMIDPQAHVFPHVLDYSIQL